jgi:hypothetical protein
VAWIRVRTIPTERSVIKYLFVVNLTLHPKPNSHLLKQENSSVKLHSPLQTQAIDYWNVRFLWIGCKRRIRNSVKIMRLGIILVISRFIDWIVNQKEYGRKRSSLTWNYLLVLVWSEKSKSPVSLISRKLATGRDLNLSSETCAWDRYANSPMDTLLIRQFHEGIKLLLHLDALFCGRFCGFHIVGICPLGVNWVDVTQIKSNLVCKRAGNNYKTFQLNYFKSRQNNQNTK